LDPWTLGLFMPTTITRPKGIYIWNTTAPQKKIKKNLWAKVATDTELCIFDPTNNPKPLNP
jgi:hypothetical protein